MPGDADDAASVARVAAIWQAGRAAWPQLQVEPVRFAAWVTQLLGDGDELHAADLYLAAACLDGDPAALAAFARAHLAPTQAALRRAGYDHGLVDEAIQLLRYRLLVATPEREPKLRTYRGRGTLAGWVRITALRQARALLGPRAKALDTLEPDGEPTRVELAILIRDHGERVRALIRAAIAELDPPQREALRLEVVEGLPHHQIAELAGVHRTTIVRRIEEARQRVADRLRGTLRSELAIGANTADSLLRTLAGIDVSLASALRG